MLNATRHVHATVWDYNHYNPKKRQIMKIFMNKQGYIISQPFSGVTPTYHCVSGLQQWEAKWRNGMILDILDRYPKTHQQLRGN